ncbi:putative ubiquitin-conjugating enzyme E2 38 [Impatiens glandulifera]|uniref:putative ubiquitin-conjugating enzyme E2 38 n=1 Tax=Impatiens glandulifera TaxID=253017 RepID=UPI001FB17EBC|nr:putative ubiquitin-conjugating enzyme E2 38 [Impatiens glandulifera]
MTEFKHYGRFDFVDRFPNHFFETLNLHKPSSMWIKRVQEELKFLDNMPDSINVKACEARMDLIQAVIVGSAGTPYHDGLFVFDLAFPPSYPDVLPIVYYHSGGLQLNPNMSKDGIVRLNTWKLEEGEPIPKMSTMAQVLCSIQVLIFNSKPFFNEPGNSEIYVGKKGKKKSKDYNESVFILSLKTMMNTLTSPPEHFEELIKWHFRVRAHHILSACKSYIDGTQIGAFGGGFVDDDQSGPSSEFKIALCGMMDDLVNKFIDNGATDCEKFRYVLKSFIPIAPTLYAADGPVALVPFLLGLVCSLFPSRLYSRPCCCEGPGVVSAFFLVLPSRTKSEAGASSSPHRNQVSFFTSLFSPRPAAARSPHLSETSPGLRPELYEAETRPTYGSEAEPQPSSKGVT